MADRFPNPYVSDVKKDVSLMVYINTETMGIGANKAGLPKAASEGPGSLDHVGTSAGGKNKK